MDISIKFTKIHSLLKTYKLLLSIIKMCHIISIIKLVTTKGDIANEEAAEKDQRNEY
jgi:hypothetical protein